MYIYYMDGWIHMYRSVGGGGITRGSPLGDESRCHRQPVRPPPTPNSFRTSEPCTRLLP